MKPHGTVARYQRQHCRCERCRKANAQYQRTRRPARGRLNFEPSAWKTRTGYLLVQCWCQASFVKVHIDDVRACLTQSCGLDECRP